VTIIPAAVKNETPKTPTSRRGIAPKSGLRDVRPKKDRYSPDSGVEKVICDTEHAVLNEQWQRKEHAADKCLAYVSGSVLVNLLFDLLSTRKPIEYKIPADRVEKSPR